MDATLFSNLLQSGHVLTPEEWRQAEEASQQYPYCAPLQLLAFQAAVLMGDAAPAAERRASVALCLPDPGCLDTPHFQRPAETLQDPPSVDILKEINAYHEVSFKTAPKSVILSHFLDTAGYDVSSESVSDSQSIEELGRVSLQRDDEICTETLAQILARQGKHSEAIEVYGKLMRKYPEKSATFADRIAALQKEVNN
ncbi:MAG: hypothetical protein AUK63_1215 [bacterium P3]|nr:MAG: hypothetical protein AUK63_1215 [bacterium P3]KWW40491.1 MAG: hypothetical protein F083_1560 [bacterium F083]